MAVRPQKTAKKETHCLLPAAALFVSPSLLACSSLVAEYVHHAADHLIGRDAGAYNNENGKNQYDNSINYFFFSVFSHMSSLPGV
jgi:hypothetical protein